MAQLFKSFIPVEFLDSWTRGQYVIGPRTLDYQYAGLALIFRGFYRYDVWRMRNEDREDLFGGYVAVDIQDNELNFAGFRLYSRDNAADERTPLFWKSVFSRFIDNETGSTDLYFPYHIFRDRPASSSQAAGEVIRSFAQRCSGPHDLDEIEQYIMHAETNASADQLLPVHRVLSELCERVDDPAGKPELRGLCMLTRPPGSRRQQQDKRDPRWDLVLDGANYGVLIDNPILGTVQFKRLSEGFLKKVDLAGHDRDREGVEP